AGNDRMITSVFSPWTKRSLCAPTVLKCSSTSWPLARVNSGASSLTGPSTAPALMTLILAIRFPLSSRQERDPARRVGDHLDRRAVKRLKLCPVEHRADGTFGDPGAFTQQVGAVGRPHGVIGIVGGEKHAMAR